MPYFICPNCKERSIDHDRTEGLTRQAVACHHCGFGFLFELLDDYYPSPNTGFVVCDAEARILASGRDVFELSGFREQELMGREVVESFGLSGFEEGQNPAVLALDLDRIFLARQPEPLREAPDVGVDDDSLRLAELSGDDVRRLPRDTR